MGIRFWSITQPFFVQFQKERYPRAQVLTLFTEFDIFGPKMGVAATRPILGIGSSGPHQKFGHGSFLFGQLLSQNRVSQKI